MSLDLQIAALVPQTGTMCLLDAVLEWSAERIVCSATSHLSPLNPLRRDGRLPAVCGLEYALQAAAAHGTLLHAHHGPGPQSGLLASLRVQHMRAEPIDDPGLGVLRATAVREHATDSGSIYEIGLHGEHGQPVLTGRATIVFGLP